jgi:glycosyltransferase involved in cell wall biosynthesis
MNKIPLTVWMNMPTFYQADLFRALAATAAVDLRVIFARPLSSDRVALGWQADTSGYQSEVLDPLQPRRQAWAMANAQADRVHMINGLWAESAFMAALAALRRRNIPRLIYAEAPDPQAPRSQPKTALKHLFGRWACQGRCGLLAISHFSADFYAQFGLAGSHVYPFGYFRHMAERQALPTPDGVEFLYVGQLVARKGLDLLLAALAPLMATDQSMRLRLIGTGEQEAALRQMAQQAGLAERILFMGAVPAAEVPTYMQRAHALVLPSRWDGWGLVVNEALAMGVPAIVSDRCGAADVIRDGQNGFRFKSESAADLSRALNAFLESRPHWPAMRANAAQVGRQLEAKPAAEYLAAALQHFMGMATTRPTPPWEIT